LASSLLRPVFDNLSIFAIVFSVIKTKTPHIIDFITSELNQVMAYKNSFIDGCMGLNHTFNKLET
jgi:hypothetical protein